MTYKIVALAIILLLIIIDYAMFATASRADKQAEEMYRKWKMQSIDSNIGAENAKYTFRKGVTNERSDSKNENGSYKGQRR